MKKDIVTKPMVYSGKVKVTLMHGRKPFKVIKQHNEGTRYFQEFILRGIMGEYTTPNMPNHIKLYHNSDTPIVSYKVPVAEIIQNFNTSGDPSIAFKFFIADTVVQGKTFSKLKLFNSSDVEYATCDLNSAITVASNSNTNVEIEWSMYIGIDEEVI